LFLSFHIVRRFQPGPELSHAPSRSESARNNLAQQRPGLLVRPKSLIQLSFDVLDACDSRGKQLGDGLSNKTALLRQVHRNPCSCTRLFTSIQVWVFCVRRISFVKMVSSVHPQRISWSHGAFAARSSPKVICLGRFLKCVNSFKLPESFGNFAC